MQEIMKPIKLMDMYALNDLDLENPVPLEDLQCPGDMYMLIVCSTEEPMG